MKTINNLYLLLNQENNILINYLSIVNIFLKIIIILNLFLTILNKKTTLKNKIIFTINFTALFIISNFIIHKYLIFNYSSYLPLLFMSILSSLLLKIPYLKSLASTIAVSIISNLISSITTLIFLNFLKIKLINIETTPLYYILYNLTITLSLYILTKILQIKKIKLKFINPSNKEMKNLVTLNIILGLLILLFQNYTNIKHFYEIPLHIEIISTVSLIFYIILNIYFINKLFSLIKAKKELKITKKHNETLNILYENIKEFKHDFNNIITTIGGFIESNDIKGLNDYYKALENQCEHLNNLEILNPTLINNFGIYNLLTKKYNEAISKNIKVNLSILTDLSNLSISTLDLSRVLGILLDNAIEATENSKEKIIDITFRKDIKTQKNIFLIRNTYTNIKNKYNNKETISKDLIFNKNYSSKPNHQGIGLWEVRKTLNKYNNANLLTTINKNTFTQQIEISDI